MAWERWWLWGGIWVGHPRQIGMVQGWQWGNWFVVSPGIGTERSGALAAKLSAAPFEEVWLVGICGGLNLQLAAGDLVQVTAHSKADAENSPCPAELAKLSWQDLPLIGQQDLIANVAHPRVYSGAALCSDRILSRAEKLRYTQTQKAAIVEMESAVWQPWSDEHQLSFVHLRVVSDPAEQEPVAWNRLWPNNGWLKQHLSTEKNISNQAASLSNRGARWRGLFAGGLKASLSAASSLRKLGNCLAAIGAD